MCFFLTITFKTGHLSIKCPKHLLEQTMESSRKRKSAPETDRNHAESEMRRRKMKALENHADYGFIVGPQKESAEVNLTQNLNKQMIDYILQLMRCFKSDLLAASEYFEGLMRSPLTENPPVWIKHIQPHIFKLVLK